MKILAKTVGFWDGALVHPGETLELPDDSAVPAWAINLDTLGSPAAPAPVANPFAQRTLREIEGEKVTADQYYEVKVPERAKKKSAPAAPAAPAAPFVERQ